ncbi:hypothetical protein DPMN_145963, partial [Dreissena polymorpha]
MKLTNQLCTGKVMGDLVVFNQRYTKCSSTSKMSCRSLLSHPAMLVPVKSLRGGWTNADNVVYYNQLVYPESNIPFPIIVHGYRWK